MGRIIGAARSAFEERFCQRTVSRFDEPAKARQLALLGPEASATARGGRGLMAELKADPGPVGLETLLREVDKLNTATGLGLPAGLFADASEKLVDAWRARAAREDEVQMGPVPVGYSPGCPPCWVMSVFSMSTICC